MSSSSRLVRCQLEGCANEVSSKAYYQRYKICIEHATLSSLEREGRVQRWCQQCGRFHDLAEFDGDRRTCRAKLSHHNIRRKMARSLTRSHSHSHSSDLQASGASQLATAGSVGSDVSSWPTGQPQQRTAGGAQPGPGLRVLNDGHQQQAHPLRLKIVRASIAGTQQQPPQQQQQQQLLPSLQPPPQRRQARGGPAPAVAPAQLAGAGPGPHCMHPGAAAAAAAAAAPKRLSFGPRWASEPGSRRVFDSWGQAAVPQVPTSQGHTSSGRVTSSLRPSRAPLAAAILPASLPPIVSLPEDQEAQPSQPSPPAAPASPPPPPAAAAASPAPPQRAQQLQPGPRPGPWATPERPWSASLLGSPGSAELEPLLNALTWPGVQQVELLAPSEAPPVSAQLCSPPLSLGSDPGMLQVGGSPLADWAAAGHP